MNWIINLLILPISRVFTWSPSHITGILYCDNQINETIEEYDQHFWELRIYYDLNITFSTCYSTFDAQIMVFNISQNEISSKYCAGDDCQDTKTKCLNGTIKNEFFTMPLNAGIYYIRINGFSSDNGLYAIQTTCSDPNILFANTTIIYTTTTTESTTDETSIITTTGKERGNTTQLILTTAVSAVFIIGFLIVIGLIISFIIWFCKHTKKKEKQTKIAFSKLKNEVEEIGRRNSVISLQNVNVNMLQNQNEFEEQKAIIRINNEENDFDLPIYSNNQCVLCCENIANIVLWPCAHVCFCNKCANAAIQNDRLCPQCRHTITDFKQIFRGGFRV